MHNITAGKLSHRPNDRPYLLRRSTTSPTARQVIYDTPPQPWCTYSTGHILSKCKGSDMLTTKLRVDKFRHAIGLKLCPMTVAMPSVECDIITIVNYSK